MKTTSLLPRRLPLIKADLSLEEKYVDFVWTDEKYDSKLSNFIIKFNESNHLKSIAATLASDETSRPFACSNGTTAPSRTQTMSILGQGIKKMTVAVKAQRIIGLYFLKEDGAYVNGYNPSGHTLGKQDVEIHDQTLRENEEIIGFYGIS